MSLVVSSNAELQAKCTLLCWTATDKSLPGMEDRYTPQYPIQCNPNLPCGIAAGQCFDLSTTKTFQVVTAFTTSTLIRARVYSLPWRLSSPESSMLYQSLASLQASRVCGDGNAVGKPCDDGNTLGGDGCTATCALEPGFNCTLAPGTTRTVCARLPSAAPPDQITTGTMVFVAVPLAAAAGILLIVAFVYRYRPELFLAGPLARFKRGLDPESDQKEIAAAAAAGNAEEQAKLEARRKKKMEEQMEKALKDRNKAQAAGQAWNVRVTVVRASNLPVCDIPFRDAQFVGLADPFCTLEVVKTNSTVRSSVVKRTAVCYSTLFPVWDECFSFKMATDEAILIRVWDFDYGKLDDYIGSVRLEGKVMSENWHKGPPPGRAEATGGRGKAYRDSMRLPILDRGGRQVRNRETKIGADIELLYVIDTTFDPVKALKGLQTALMKGDAKTQAAFAVSVEVLRQIRRQCIKERIEPEAAAAAMEPGSDGRVDSDSVLAGLRRLNIRVNPAQIGPLFHRFRTQGMTDEAGRINAEEFAQLVCVRNDRGLASALGRHNKPGKADLFRLGRMAVPVWHGGIDPGQGEHGPDTPGCLCRDQWICPACGHWHRHRAPPPPAPFIPIDSNDPTHVAAAEEAAAARAASGLRTALPVCERCGAPEPSAEDRDVRQLCPLRQHQDYHRAIGIKAVRNHTAAADAAANGGEAADAAAAAAAGRLGRDVFIKVQDSDTLAVNNLPEWLLKIKRQQAAEIQAARRGGQSFAGGAAGDGMPEKANLQPVGYVPPLPVEGGGDTSLRKGEIVQFVAPDGSWALTNPNLTLVEKRHVTSMDVDARRSHIAGLAGGGWTLSVGQRGIERRRGPRTGSPPAADTTAAALKRPADSGVSSTTGRRRQRRQDSDGHHVGADAAQGGGVTAASTTTAVMTWTHAVRGEDTGGASSRPSPGGPVEIVDQRETRGGGGSNEEDSPSVDHEQDDSFQFFDSESEGWAESVGRPETPPLPEDFHFEDAGHGVSRAFQSTAQATEIQAGNHHDWQHDRDFPNSPTPSRRLKDHNLSLPPPTAAAQGPPGAQGAGRILVAYGQTGRRRGHTNPPEDEAAHRRGGDLLGKLGQAGSMTVASPGGPAGGLDEHNSSTAPPRATATLEELCAAARREVLVRLGLRSNDAAAGNRAGAVAGGGSSEPERGVQGARGAPLEDGELGSPRLGGAGAAAGFDQGAQPRWKVKELTAVASSSGFGPGLGAMAGGGVITAEVGYLADGDGAAGSTFRAETPRAPLHDLAGARAGGGGLDGSELARSDMHNAAARPVAFAESLKFGRPRLGRGP